MISFTDLCIQISVFYQGVNIFPLHAKLFFKAGLQ